MVRDWPWLKLTAVVLALLVYLVIIPSLFAERSYILTIVITASMLAFIGLGVWLTFAIGRINIGQGGFALIGSYTAAVLMERWGLSFWLVLPCAAIVAGSFGAIIGYPILRLKGVYFAMLTLCLGEAIRLATLNAEALTGGARGIVNIQLPGSIEVFGLVLVPAFQPGDRLAFYYLGAALLIAGLALLWRIHTSRLGAVFRSLQQNEELATSVGINVARYRVLAYAIACAYAGIGGAFFATLQQNVYPSSFQVSDSVYLMMYSFIGGLSHPVGAVVGAFALISGFEFLGAFGQYQSILLASLMIFAIIALPNGLISLWPKGRDIVRPHRSRAVSPQQALKRVG
ncbi:MAG: branched-chain amino acid ABC transporter permease [Pseudomonadota bacterium]